jgi:hypothetical protein
MFSRISNESNVTTMETDALPVSVPNPSDDIAHWVYKNLPLEKGAKAELLLSDVMSNSHTASVKVYSPKGTISISFSYEENSDND